MPGQPPAYLMNAGYRFGHCSYSIEGCLRLNFDVFAWLLFAIVLNKRVIDLTRQFI